jgi:hypothetical protein
LKNLFDSGQVIMESLRMASIISFTFREAVEDVVYNGTHTRVQSGSGMTRPIDRVSVQQCTYYLTKKMVSTLYLPDVRVRTQFC